MNVKKAVKDPTLAQQAAAETASKDAETVKKLQSTEAGAIWDEIKDKPIDMFALPDQQVHMHVHPVNIEPSKLYLVLNSSSVLPSLEAAVGNKFVVELVNKYVSVTRAVVPATAK